MAYITKSGDTWDMIAKEVYGSEYHADVLMAANAAHIETFIFQAGGTVHPGAGGGTEWTAAAVEI